MKNVLTFFFVWVVVSLAYTYYRNATALDRKEVFKILGVGALTAAVATITLTVIVVLF